MGAEMSTYHELKCRTEYFSRIQSGQKTFEIRKNDRDFQVGDTLSLREWLPDRNQYCDHSAPIEAEIVYMTSYEQKEGYVVLGIKIAGGTNA